MQDVLDVETLVGNQFVRASTAHKSIARRLTSALRQLSTSSSTDNFEDEEDSDEEYEEEDENGDTSFEEWSTTENEDEDEDEADDENHYIAIDGAGSSDTEQEIREEVHASATNTTANSTRVVPLGTLSSANAAGWSVGEVVQWLNRNELDDFVEKFEHHRFAGEQLLLLDWSSVKLLGQRSSARRKSLLDNVAVLTRKIPAALSRSARKTMAAASPHHKRRFTTARKIRRGLTTKGTPLRKSTSAAAAAVTMAAAVAKSMVDGAASFPAPPAEPAIAQPSASANTEKPAEQRRRRSLHTPPLSPSKEMNSLGLNVGNHKTNTAALLAQTAAGSDIIPQTDPEVVHTYVNLQSLGLNTAGDPVVSKEEPTARSIAASDSKSENAPVISTAPIDRVPPKTDESMHTYVNLQSMGLNTAGEPVVSKEPAVLAPTVGSNVQYTEVQIVSKRQESSDYGTAIAPDDAAVHTYVNVPGRSTVQAPAAGLGVLYTEVEHALKQQEDLSAYGTAIAPEDDAGVHGEPLYDTRTLPESKVTPIKHHEQQREELKQLAALTTAVVAATPAPPPSAEEVAARTARPRAATVGFDYADPRSLNVARKQKQEADTASTAAQQGRARPRAATLGFDYADPRKLTREAAQQHTVTRAQPNAAVAHKQHQKKPQQQIQQQQQQHKGRRGVPSQQQPGGDRRKGLQRIEVAAPPVPERPSRTETSSGELDLSVFPWYRGLMSRQDAEQLLASAREGTFLMRSSSRAPEPVVSFVHVGTIQHCRVRKSDEGLYKLGDIKDGGYHQSLRGMFQHFAGAGSLLQHAI